MTPLSKVYDNVWAVAEGSPRFASLIREANKIKFSKRDPFKLQVQASDMPEVILTLNNVSFNPHVNSSMGMCVATYAWIVSTGDFRLEGYILDVI